MAKKGVLKTFNDTDQRNINIKKRKKILTFSLSTIAIVIATVGIWCACHFYTDINPNNKTSAPGSDPNDHRIEQSEEVKKPNGDSEIVYKPDDVYEEDKSQAGSAEDEYKDEGGPHKNVDTDSDEFELF